MNKIENLLTTEIDGIKFQVEIASNLKFSKLEIADEHNWYIEDCDLAQIIRALLCSTTIEEFKTMTTDVWREEGLHDLLNQLIVDECLKYTCVQSDIDGLWRVMEVDDTPTGTCFSVGNTVEEAIDGAKRFLGEEIVII